MRFVRPAHLELRETHSERIGVDAERKTAREPRLDRDRPAPAEGIEDAIAGARERLDGASSRRRVHARRIGVKPMNVSASLDLRLLRRGHVEGLGEAEREFGIA